MKKINDIKPGSVVILADGLFPQREEVLRYLNQAVTIICCDGATIKLEEYGLTPSHIVGDMDSLPQGIQDKYKNIIVSSSEQESNDLTKAINFALSIGVEELVLLGATGLREDHTLGNMGLLVEHGQKLKLQLVSDYAIMVPLYTSATLQSIERQQVSIFALVGTPEITTDGLKYPIHQRVLTNWWQGTLNEAVSTSFSLDFDNGALLVQRLF